MPNTEHFPHSEIYTLNYVWEAKHKLEKPKLWHVFISILRGKIPGLMYKTSGNKRIIQDPEPKFNFRNLEKYYKSQSTTLFWKAIRRVS